MTRAANPRTGADTHDRVITVLRVRYAKTGKIRFTSHRDVARIWERALRRVGVPVVRTEGFTPRPRVAFGLALPTGYESIGEYLDIEVEEPSSTDALTGVGIADGCQLALDELPDLLTAALPVGMEVQTIELRNGRGTSLQEQVIRCGWSFEIRDLDEATARRRVIELLDSATLPTTRQHKGKERTDDLRPAIHHLEVLGTGPNGVLCAAELSAKPRVVRPSEVATVMAPTHEMGVAVRLTQLIEHDDSLRELIPSTDSSAPHARERAS